MTRASRTQEQTATEEEQRLRLIAENTAPRANVSWAEDTVDNEHLNRKKSKICCIYHSSEEFDESSEEEHGSSSSSSSESESDSDSNNDQSRHCRHDHSHNHSHKHRRHRPNAYERLPRRRAQ